MLKEKVNWQPRILDTEKISFKNESKVKTFSSSPLFREFMCTRLPQQEIPKEILQAKDTYEETHNRRDE